ncbi:MAG: hypothetical protein MJ071_00465 [Oscillospiraceae bacterium]|nr:hypothetical protein [Oscillospiraceae bacterium]
MSAAKPAILPFMKQYREEHTADHPFVRMLYASDKLPSILCTMHFDLAGQGSADIQMLYYYTTFGAKMQVFLQICSFHAKTAEYRTVFLQ